MRNWLLIPWGEWPHLIHRVLDRNRLLHAMGYSRVYEHRVVLGHQEWREVWRATPHPDVGGVTGRKYDTIIMDDIVEPNPLTANELDKIPKKFGRCLQW